MKVGYQSHIGIDPISGEPQYVMRPEVTITIHGPTRSQQYHALVDTGADYSVLPTSVAQQLGIATQPTVGLGATSVGGHKLATTFGDVEFEISDERESFRWPTTVLFYDAKDEIVILGHVGFLHYFIAQFDGYAMELSLTPVEDFPGNPV